MRNLIVTAVLVLCAGTAWGVENNDFYDNTPAQTLAGPAVAMAGEVSNPGPADWSNLPVRSVIVRETVLKEGTAVFTGAYRYDGYSLFDILKERYVTKKNENEFKPIVDMLVSVENEQGDKVILSWGEIFYPAVLHQILIATAAAPINPSHSDDRWKVPETTRLVCGCDLLTIRNVEQPSRITVFASPRSFPAEKGKSPLYSPEVRFYRDGAPAAAADIQADEEDTRIYPTVFYGRGHGFHGISRFRGKLFKEVLRRYFQPTIANLTTGYLVVKADDGYRITASFSEVCNRLDQADFLFIDMGEHTDGGRFKLFPAPDFFSDRAVKSITDVYLEHLR